MPTRLLLPHEVFKFPTPNELIQQKLSLMQLADFAKKQQVQDVIGDVVRQRLMSSQATIPQTQQIVPQTTTMQFSGIPLSDLGGMRDINQPIQFQVPTEQQPQAMPQQLQQPVTDFMSMQKDIIMAVARVDGAEALKMQKEMESGETAKAYAFTSGVMPTLMTALKDGDPTTKQKVAEHLRASGIPSIVRLADTVETMKLTDEGNLKFNGIFNGDFLKTALGAARTPEQRKYIQDIYNMKKGTYVQATIGPKGTEIESMASPEEKAKGGDRFYKAAGMPPWISRSSKGGLYTYNYETGQEELLRKDPKQLALEWTATNKLTQTIHSPANTRVRVSLKGIAPMAEELVASRYALDNKFYDDLKQEFVKAKSDKSFSGENGLIDLARNSKFWNGLEQKFRKQFSDPAVAAFLSNSMAMAERMATIYAGGSTVTSDNKIKWALELLDPTLSSDAFKAVIDNHLKQFRMMEDAMIVEPIVPGYTTQPKGETKRLKYNIRTGRFD